MYGNHNETSHDMLNSFGGIDQNSLVTHINMLEDTDEQSLPVIRDSLYYTCEEFCKVSTDSNNITILSLNIQSLRSKHDSLKLFTESVSGKIDIIMLQETWLSVQDTTSHLNIPGYSMISQPKRITSHGGLVIFLSDRFTHNIIHYDSVANSEIFEGLFVEIKQRNSLQKFVVGNVYRPPRDIIANYETFEEEINGIFSQLKFKYDNIIVGGDFNINLLEANNRNTIGSFLDSVFACSFQPTITLPTRYSLRSCSLIDNLFCKLSNSTTNNLSGIIVTQISDHLPCFVSINLKQQHAHKQCQSNFFYRRVENTQSVDNLILELQNSEIYENLNTDLRENPNNTYNSLFTFITKAMDNSMPLKKTRITHYSYPKNPWCSYDTLKSIKFRDKLYKNLKSTHPDDPRYNMLHTNLKTCNRILKSTIRKEKKAYYQSFFDQNKNDSKKTWRKLNEILGKNRHNISQTDSFRTDNTVLTNKSVISNEFNRFFASVSHTNDDRATNTQQGDFINYLTPNITSTFSFTMVNANDIVNVCNELESKQSKGHDGLSPALLKKIVCIIKEPLALIFNQSVMNGIFPCELKLSKITPLFKKNNPEHFDNYRPIAILPAISKIFEKVMHKQIYQYFSSHNLLFNSQYGFRTNHSTELAALHLCSEISKKLDNKETPFSVFLDLSKAFDLLDHHILLSKLNHYGFDAMSLALCKNYLTNRKQFVCYEQETSDTIEILKGVPQGSILGPLFFIIYINDIYLSSAKLNFILFADDTTAFSTLENFDINKNDDTVQIGNAINQELNKIDAWIVANKLKLNTSKTKAMCFHIKQKDIKYPKLFLNNAEVELVKHFNFLGIIIDESLEWSTHINSLSTKLSRTIGVINRLKNFLPLHTLKTLYYSLFASHLTYGIILWGYTNAKVFTIQKKAIRLISNAPRLAHTEPLLRQHGILKYADIISLQEHKFFYKFMNHLLPDYSQTLIDLFRKNHGLNTRINMVLQPVHTRLLFCSKTFKVNIVRNINASPTAILDKVYTHSYDGYCAYVKQYYLSLYTNVCNEPNCYACNNSRS